MKDYKYYKANFETRYGVRLSFWGSFFAFFTQHNPFDEAITQIQKRDIEETFQSDIQQLHKDFHHACINNHYFSLSEGQSKK